MISVVNKKNHQPTDKDFYVGRGSALGNPYSSIQNGKTKAQFICESREESLKNFNQYILEKIKEKDKDVCNELNNIWKLAQVEDVILVCYCSPKPCHATIIKKIVEDKLIKK